MAAIINREEFLFIYDVTDANPNGDPLDENKPRIDEESGINIVTDVRLKRTIRDFLFNFKGYNGKNGKDIFVRSTESEKGGLKDGKERTGDFKNSEEEILKSCIDIRLFGGVLPIDKDSIKFTGPIQFKMGRSLHKVELKHIKGTGAFASKAGAKQQTFREEYNLPYSLIAFYGVVNENAAKETGLSEDDLKEFYEAMWMGTKNLISRSKMGHIPRLLVKVRHKEPYFFIGDLDKYVKLQTDKADEKIRDVTDVSIDLSDLSKVLADNKDKIETINLKQGDRVRVNGWEH
ncbi:MAG: type I-B CRISPR-associated protein Cas7/Csh2 [Gracilimonas sp.]|uniref:type I-B CRISPR-associated protein Cas7/Csh2 n=1 Tax=Gracilimonas sp. TaxID=1974203 RepID=UPI003752D6D5|nr:type I-B CRISPR-associated protein Cas7/Csh2 [Gracilimonas sp.]